MEGYLFEDLGLRRITKSNSQLQDGYQITTIILEKDWIGKKGFQNWLTSQGGVNWLGRTFINFQGLLG